MKYSVTEYNFIFLDVYYVFQRRHKSFHYTDEIKKYSHESKKRTLFENVTLLYLRCDFYFIDCFQSEFYTEQYNWLQIQILYRIIIDIIPYRLCFFYFVNSNFLNHKPTMNLQSSGGNLCNYVRQQNSISHKWKQFRKQFKYKNNHLQQLFK